MTRETTITMKPMIILILPAVAQEVAKDPDNRRGILICGSGVGIDVAANKFSRIRSALANNPDQAFPAVTTPIPIFYRWRLIFWTKKRLRKF